MCHQKVYSQNIPPSMVSDSRAQRFSIFLAPLLFQKLLHSDPR